MEEISFAERDKLKGEKVVLFGLTKNGEALNGARGTVVDMDGAEKVNALGQDLSVWSDESTFRVHVKIPGRSTVKVRLQNIKLYRPESGSEQAGVRLTDEEVLSKFRWLTNECKETKRGADFQARDDSKARAALVYGWADGSVPLPAKGSIPCCDVTVMGKVDPNGNSILQMLARMKPICQGAGSVDFWDMSRGLYGDGVTECALCLEVMVSREEVSLLPCGHQFHPDCINQLHSHQLRDPAAPKIVMRPDVFAGRVLRPINFSCPKCRKLTTGDSTSNLAHYSMPSETRLKNRFLEFIRTGFCCACQLVFLEESQFATEEVMTVHGRADSYVGDFGRLPTVNLK